MTTESEERGLLWNTVDEYFYLTQSPTDGKIEVNDRKMGTVVYRAIDVSEAALWSVRFLVEQNIVEVKNDGSGD